MVKIQKINRLNICQKFESDCRLVENLWSVLVLVHVRYLPQEEREARPTVVFLLYNMYIYIYDDVSASVCNAIIL